MADAPDSKSGRGNPVRVQVPPPAPNLPFRFQPTFFTATSDLCSRRVFAGRKIQQGVKHESKSPCLRRIAIPEPIPFGKAPIAE